jgi:hypothetical protein
MRSFPRSAGIGSVWIGRICLRLNHVDFTDRFSQAAIGSIWPSAYGKKKPMSDRTIPGRFSRKAFAFLPHEKFFRKKKEAGFHGTGE